MNVVTYCRVSSEEQAQKDLSIPAQRKMLARWVDDHANYNLVEEFVDEGESAFAPANKRPGFSSMIAYCKRNQVSAILVHKLDRFSRNREESILFKSLLRKHGVVVKSITENFDPDTPQGFLYEGMIEVINQFYSMNLATETIKGMRENAERARFNGGRVPYGYRVERVDDGKGRTYGRLVLGPEEEQAVVRLMFDLAVNHGLGGKSITRELNRRQIPAPRGPYWNTSTVATLLDNPVYVGDQVWFKTKRVGRDGRERTDPVDRVITTNAHPAIVDRDLFERRAQLARGRSFGAPTRVEHYVEYLLSRLIKCGHCGANFSGKRQTRLNLTTGEREPWYAYYCGNYIAKGAEVCASLPLHREWIEGIVVEAIRNRLVDDAAWGRIKGKVQAKIEARRRAYGQNPKAIEAKLAELDRRIQNYVRAIGMGVDPVTVQTQIDEANHMKAALEGEARIVARQDYYDRAIETNLAELERFRGAFANGWEQFPMRVRRQIVTRFIVSIEVVNRADLHIRFQVPFDDGGLKVLVDEMEASHTPIVVEGGEYSLLDGRGGAIPHARRTQHESAERSSFSPSVHAPPPRREPPREPRERPPR